MSIWRRYCVLVLCTTDELRNVCRSLETPQKQQLLLLYPNGPLTQYPLISLRQDGGSGGVGGDFWQSIQNFFQNIGGQFGNTEGMRSSFQRPNFNYYFFHFCVIYLMISPNTAPPVVAAPPPAASSDAIIRAEPTVYSASSNAAGALFETPAPASAAAAASSAAVMPASTQPLAEKRYYILSGQPQFYGKYDAFHTPLNSVFHLQPLQQAAAIESRSAAAEPSPAAFDGAQIAADAGAANPAAATADFVQLPLQQQAVPLQLRSAFQEPLQALEPSVVESAAAAAFVPAESAQLAPVAASLKDATTAVESDNEVPRSLPVAPESENDDGLSSEKVASVASNADDTVQVNARANADTVATELEDEPQQSVANARPTGVAVAGRGGLASSKPSATALVGDGGLAMAAPLATAISGEFEEEEVIVEEESKKFEKTD